MQYQTQSVNNKFMCDCVSFTNYVTAKLKFNKIYIIRKIKIKRLQLIT